MIAWDAPTGGYLLRTGTTLTDDGQTDVLTGGLGLDVFFGPAVDVPNLAAGESRYD